MVHDINDDNHDDDDDDDDDNTRGKNGMVAMKIVRSVLQLSPAKELFVLGMFLS